MKRKKKWAQWLTCFSIPRMFNCLNTEPEALKIAIATPNQDVGKNLRIFNGIKCILSVYILLGNSCLYTYYAIVADGVQAYEFKQSFGFICIAGSILATPLLIWISGFLNAYSFLNTEESQRFTAQNLIRFYTRKIVRYLPLVFVTLLMAMFFIPLLGSGPIWPEYEEKIMKGCQKYWWTNLLFVNNIVPANQTFDDKCMPWTWFLPVIVQLSLILPLVLALYLKTI